MAIPGKTTTMNALALQAAENLDLLSKVAGFVILVAVAVGSLWYGLRTGKSKAEEEKIRPFKEAADGWERVAKQQEAELKLVRTDHERLTEEHAELMSDYNLAMRLNMRLQGSVDQLTSRVSALEEVIRILQKGDKP
jgi:hypothetical protein